MSVKVTKDKVEKALASLELALAGDGDETVSKASDDDLDQPEGADMGNPAKDKMSDSAKSKKAMKKAEDEDEGDEDSGEQMEKKKKSFDKKAPPFMKKSFDDLPEEIETKIDVSDFLKSLVNHTGDCLDNLSEFVAKSDRLNNQRYGSLEEAVEEVQKSQAKIGIVLKAICQRIGVIGAAPANAPRSETVVKSAATATDRSFSSGLEGEGTEAPMFKSLSQNPIIAKSQMANALCDLVRKGEAQDLDVIGFESGGYIRPELVSKLKTVLN